MILVDFDNTLVCSNFDLDHEHNRKKSVAWFQGKTRSEAVNFSLANLLLADWLKGREFYVCTNRGADAHNETSEALFYLFNDVPPIVYCTGTKQAVLDNFVMDYFLIDNNPAYEPNFLFTECVSIADLNETYKQWTQERGKICEI